MKMPNITKERLQQLLNLDTATGEFTWKASDKHKEGSCCTTLTKHGYLCATLDGRQYYAHRLVWLWNLGYIPPSFFCIDHINSCKTDNRFINLRMVTRAHNRQNLSAACKNNKSTGLLGVSKFKASNRYYARINYNHKQYNLGSFKTAEEAHQAYVTAKQSLHLYNCIGEKI